MSKFNIRGMGCAACVAKVEKAVSALTDVDSVSVNLLTNSMTVEGKAKAEIIIKAVRDAGYEAQEIFEIDEESLKDTTSKKILTRFIISLVLLIPMMYLSMAVPMLSAPVPQELDGTLIMYIVIAALSLTIIIINFKFYVSGFKSIIKRSPNMDLLVSLGSCASFVYSAYHLVDAILKLPLREVLGSYYTDNFFFDSAAMILVLVTIGKYLESKTKARTTSAIKKMLSLSPKTAIIYESGIERVVNIDEIRVGDIYVVKSGAKIPVDGIIIDGSGAVDESMITGESKPVDKDPSDKVYGGTINVSRYLRCRATSTSKNSTIAELIRLTAKASETKAPIARIADKVAAVFVPVVVLISIITFIAWMLIGAGTGPSLSRAVSVLVVSCPCALGLATPVAIMVASGKGARSGILFKSGEVLEKLGKVKIALIDKTGTITKGDATVTDVVPADGIEDRELLKLAYIVESHSEHPLAKAITKLAIDRYGINGIGTLYSKAEDFSIYKSAGVSAIVDGDEIIAGNEELLKNKLGILMQGVDEYSAQGKTPILFAKNGTYIGMIAVADVVKKDSKYAIKLLNKMRIKTVMLTGDNISTAKEIASQCGISKIIAGVDPEGKIKAVEHMIVKRSNKGFVAMIGDGVNDAPALARADVGVAISAGSDIASATADVILMKNNLTDFAASVRLSRATIRNIKENLFFAFCYNIIGIPLAAGALIPLFGFSLTPMFGAACMSVSSILVVLNALRLNLKNIYK